ncbi:SCO-spondin-like [Hemicordylus capensis]|uniref:SCO-spondin-like n=1 Tax=Hemicordylus capensis TaxID=884348 RepID=UPI002302220D|nr:SCO-spondin-like [Hemicordylus capensis]
MLQSQGPQVPPELAGAAGDKGPLLLLDPPAALSSSRPWPWVQGRLASPLAAAETGWPTGRSKWCDLWEEMPKAAQARGAWRRGLLVLSVLACFSLWETQALANGPAPIRSQSSQVSTPPYSGAGAWSWGHSIASAPVAQRPRRRLKGWDRSLAGGHPVPQGSFGGQLLKERWQALRRWCERTVQVSEEEVVSPRREELVPCSELYQYNMAGWLLDQDRMRQAHGREEGRAHPGTALCPVYKPEDTRPTVWNRTVRACCEGWSGPHCSEGKALTGRCFSTWQCRDVPGLQNLSLLSMDACCSRPWGRSWQNASSELCLSCSYLPLPGGPPAPTALLVRPGQHRRPFATCTTWAGFHYRSFDGKHFRFHGTCAYTLAAAPDGSWAIDISSSRGRCALRMLFGLDLVVAQGQNVSVNGAEVPEGEPRLQKGISVWWLGDFLFVESGLGVRVKFDRRDTVYVTVGTELRGATQGLCGVYNEDSSDDFRRVEGDVARLAASFGNSWRIPEAGPCQDAAEEAHSCEVVGSQAAQQEAGSVCQKLLSSPFSQCHSEVDPNGFHDSCMFLHCSRAEMGAICDTFASYARECAQRSILVNWRRSGFCEKVCGQGKHYSDCVSSCPASCATVGTDGEGGRCREECVSGCECPPGLYLEGGACVPGSQCPCYHRRQKYAPGETHRQHCNQCTCQGGRWLCSQDQCARECSLLGNTHYLTFDHRRYSFHGACQYILVQDFVDGKLHITAENEACGSQGALSCLRATAVTVQKVSARLSITGEVSVNGQEVALPFASADLTVRRASSSFLLLQAFGAHLLWGLDRPALYITLQPGFAHKVRGLCGTYNWNQQDEFTTPEGDLESSAAAFANQFRASRECPPAGPSTSDPCSTYAQRRQFAEAACSVLHRPPFQPCHDLVEREPFYQLCLYDVCGCSASKDCLCNAVAAYARECAQEGVPVAWRNQSFCPVLCSGGQVYQECATPCRRTCADLRTEALGACQDLEGVCVAGCNCPEGLVLDDDGQCVRPGSCPCRHREEAHPPGSTIQRSCNTCVCVDGAWNCTAEICPEAVLCPGELIYAFGSCLRTCESPEGNLSCAGLSDGCVCPPGTVFLNERCVPPEECPCHHHGRLYQPNDTIARDCNTCTCRSRHWECSRRPCAGVCVATGDPHYITFDGRAYSFLGDCEYILAQESSGAFTVTAENVPCGTSGTTCTKSVVVLLGSTVVHLLRGKDVTVNGVSVRPPKTYSGNGLSLERAGLFLALTSQLGLTVLWDGGTRVYVKLDPLHQGRVAGLCGNFDGDTENDFTSRQGIVEPTADLLGNSWRLSLFCPEVRSEDFEHPCTVNSHRVAWARKRCGILLQDLFAPCREELPCQQFYEWCVFDACGCDSGGDCECLCTAIATYAEECSQRGVSVRWRSQELCPLQCDHGLEYDPCGPACPQTCKNFGLEPAEHCEALSCVEGCFCLEGKVLHDGRCIDPSECPCFWGGTLFPLGALVTQECRNCSCEAGLWQCSAPLETCTAPSHCSAAEFACHTGGRCVPSAWVCDNEDDCGDGSDEFCVLHCAPHQYQCASGQCVPWGYRCDGTADCLDRSDERGCPLPACALQEFRCANGRCIPRQHVCDGELDCGFADHSDEAGCGPPCGPSEFRCAVGRCLPYLHRCDGHDDCGDFSDEGGCLCPAGDFQCPDGRCLAQALVCDGKRDCSAGTDEASCPGHVTCAPGQLPCPDGVCVSRLRECDGVRDCADGADEDPALCLEAQTTAPLATIPSKLPGTHQPPANRTLAPPCGRYEFYCHSGECQPRGWVCDNEADCLDGSDELDCNRTCGLDQFPCTLGGECIHYSRLCDGAPHCWDHSDESIDTCGSTQIPPCPGFFICNSRVCINVSRVCDGSPDCPQGEDELACGSHMAPPRERNQTAGPCAEYSCGDGTCIAFKQVCNGLADCVDGSEATSWLPSDEWDCGLWSTWGPWSPCSQSCGTGLQVRRRSCTRRADDVLRHCLGKEAEAQQCFSVACPVDSVWSEWAVWSNCSRDCRGVVVRHRECLPPQNGGRHCTEMPDASAGAVEIQPCQLEGCLNASACPRDLVSRKCAPCPTSCAELSSRTRCRKDRPCSPGCWCPDGLVLDSEQQCVHPRECPCQVEGSRYWPGQLVKVNCRICTCQDGQMKRCRQNPECTVNCGWSSWSPWGECLGPCGVQSIQWSFRSPNNPSKHGNGRQCRGIYRKARRCQTEPCEECEHHGRAHEMGGRWRSGQCQVCQCLPNLTVQCSQYCPYHTVPCPEGRVLVEGRGDTCCYCMETGENRTTAPAVPAVTPLGPTGVGPAGFTTPLPLSTFPLPPLGDLCYSPLGISSLPDASFSASSQQPENPAHAARLNRILPDSDLQGWAPPADAYPELLSQPPFLHVDLGERRNITGVVVQGAGSSDAYVTSFSLQFSLDGVRWHDYHEASSMGATLEPKLFQGNSDDSTPVVRTFQRMVHARHIRLLPRDFHNRIFLRMELLGCGKVSPELPGIPTASPGWRPCRAGEFQCRNGRCVPAGPQGAICDGVNDCWDFSDELPCGAAPSLEPVPGTCLLSQFHCAASNICLEASRRCDGATDCPDAADEAGCGPAATRLAPEGTSSPRRPPLRPSVPHPTQVSPGGWPFPEGFTPTPPGLCSEPLGLEDGRVQHQQLSASSFQDGNPPDAGRLHIVPNMQDMEPGWSPRRSDRSPYFQVDFLRPTFITAVVTQGGSPTGGYIARYRLAHSKDGVHFQDYIRAGSGAGASLQATVLEGNSDSATPVRQELRPALLARVLRLVPTEFRGSISLRMEALGCPWKTKPTEGAATPTGSIRGPGTAATGTASLPRRLTGTPGLAATTRGPGAPSAPPATGPSGSPRGEASQQLWGPATSAALFPGTPSVAWPTGPGPKMPTLPRVTAGASGAPGLPGTYTLPSQPGKPGVGPTFSGPSRTPSPGRPRTLCTQGQFACEAFGCIEAALVCDGREDCLDGSDELHCGGPTAATLPTALPLSPVGPPGACSTKQFSCGSRECLALERRCDLRHDCQDGSDEANCVDCILSPWTAWSECSRSCGLGVTFRRRDFLRHALPGGQCDRDEFDSRSCFLQACPVNGAWASWGEWSDCDAECRGGVRSRTRTCADPPPKNGGQPCPGDAVQMETCNRQPCGDARDCGPDMVYVQAGHCERGLVAPCPQLCQQLSAEMSCHSSCVEGCRCPPGLFLQDGGCVNISQCHCFLGRERRLPGEMFLRDNCSQCVCLEGTVTCDSVACPVNCGWSAWSPWTPCSRSCGVGMQQRFRSPSNPAAANGGAPCQGDVQEVRECHTACIPEMASPWSNWTPWSPCSKTCFYATDGVGVKKRFRHCNGSSEATGCSGEVVQEEPCETPPCPVGGLWTPWTAWSPCSARCDSGVQTRNRSCSNPAYGGPECSGPLIQTRDCNTQPCKALCPGNMVYQTAEECQQKGGACPRLCLDQGTRVECASHCYEGCYCPDGLFLQNDTCVPLSECPCYHQGELYQPGNILPLDSCNNCTCTDGEMACGTEPCPVDCAWGVWSSCSRSCNVGTRRRHRSGSELPATARGQQCQGPHVEIEFCSLQPCQGSGMDWGPWSECSVPCGGGYRNRTRASAAVLRRIDFATCNLQPCPGEEPGVCPEGKVWRECVAGPASCAALSTEPAADGTCLAGCYCPRGAVLLNNLCVPEEECPCAQDGVLYAPGEAVPQGCENCSCVLGRVANCSRESCGDVNGGWSAWAPWSACSAACGLGLRSRYHFCTDPAPSGMGVPCLGPEREDQPCLLPPCARSGAWGQWSPWTGCTISCGGGMRSRMRACDSPAPQGGGDYCEGAPTQVEACHLDPCPALDCSSVEGSVYSSCGPPCPRTCDDLSHCIWSCEPGCYCPGGKLLAANGTACLEKASCPCLEPLTGRRLLPGETLPGADGCNSCTCSRGKLICSQEACAVPGGWCDWSPWSPCSRTCGSEMVSRYRTCSCPKPQQGGPECEGAQEHHGDSGVQLQRQPCPLATFCPVDGAWSTWSAWSPCDACLGEVTRSRICSNPPARFGGLPCPGEAQQSRACHDGVTVCEDCSGGQVSFPCGKACPRTCEDLHPGSACLESPRCQLACACPDGELLQDGACVRPARCRCKYQNGWLGAPEERGLSSWPGPLPWEDAQPGETVFGACQNCTCVAGRLECRVDPSCRLDGGWGPWGPWSPCTQSCGEGTQFRFRECDNPPPQNGGRGCVGNSKRQRACQSQQECPEEEEEEEEEAWGEWSAWAPCSVSCGGGEQLRSRRCRQPGCQGLAVQSKTCHTEVCLEVGCPVGRLYRECLKEEGCPYSCAHLAHQMDCFSDGCEEGCHCPVGTFQHGGACVQECPCVLTEEALKMFRSHSPDLRTAQGRLLSPGEEVPPNGTIYSACSNCSCHHGQLACTSSLCPVDGGFAPWSPWAACSLTCGGLGNMTRSRDCTDPVPANAGKECVGPRVDIKFCQTPDCEALAGPTKEPVSGSPGSEEDSFTLWSPWTPCSKTCSDPDLPAVKTRLRFCPGGANCSGDSFQERECNLPQCTDTPLCQGEECLGMNCTWNPWSPWSECSRSCGVGQQRRLRTYHLPGQGGHWCQDILTANAERRFCNLQACKVDGAWSKWSPWSWCDRTCGGGRSVRTRTCTSPPPKNGGRHCPGEKYHVRVCNPQPCEEGCPPTMSLVDCAGRCPRHCWDLQEGLVCQDGGEACEPGCRCPEGMLEQDGGCVSPEHCECTDAQGHSWVAGSLRQDGCHNCTCSEGRLLCTNQTCLPSAACGWSLWSRWAPCSATCGDGLRTRFRTPTSSSWAPECLKEELQTRPCAPGPCPPLCLRGGQEMPLGSSWLQGECQQCMCTPEGIYCLDIACAVHGAWTPWSPWSDCPITCGRGTQIRTRACINPPPRNDGSPCAGPEVQAQNCSAPPCSGDESCHWSAWGPCSRSCGTGLSTRTGLCPCPTPQDAGAPCTDSRRQEVGACFLRACEECPWSPWTQWTGCSCSSLVQQRYRNQQGSGADGEPCVGLDGQFRMCDSSQCSESSCEGPFEFQQCGSPCDRLCSTLRHPELCRDIPRCLPGCYCPQGLVEQNGACVPPSQCGCLHLSQSEGPVYLAAEDTVLIGCKECVCQQGELQCSSSGCQGLLPLSAWSEWTPCSSCLPLVALSPSAASVLLAQHHSWHQEAPAQPTLVSVQHRYRLCLDPQTGRPWAGEASLCPAELAQEQLCPDPHACEDFCLWGDWSPWSPCQEPCSGGFRLRWRSARHPAGGHLCRGGPRSQSESCNTAACPGEECGHRGKVPDPACANGCPRTCADLWEHVECLQGGCKPGCRCPEGQLLQDGVCVPVPACRCGLPMANGTLEFGPGQAEELDCHNCTCLNGTFACPEQECPSYGEWSAWSPCSASCGGGSSLRRRPCHESPSGGGAPCAADAMEEVAQCRPEACPADCQVGEWSAWSTCSASCGGGLSERSRVLLSPPGEPCPVPLRQHHACSAHNCTPECPGAQVYSQCANTCPQACADLRTESQCLQEACQPGCSCPSGQVLQDGACVPLGECRCSLGLGPATPWAANLSQEEWNQEHLPGSIIWHECNSCICRGGVFSCTQEDCDVPCSWSEWAPWSPCSVTCGPGERISRRHQLQQRLYGGAECEGPAVRQTSCALPNCACPGGERWLGAGPPGPPCERSCRQVYEDPPQNCSREATPGCVCQAGHYRARSGRCVTAAHCECEHGGQLYSPGTEWLHGCELCRCLNGRVLCEASCPELTCLEGEVKIREANSCCPVCREELVEESRPQCQRLTELRNITKGRCFLAGVEVSFCRGQCASHTNVIPEEPYLQTLCDCCSYRLDPVSPVRILNLQCGNGETEPVVLPVIHSCECSSCQGGDFSRR